MPEAVLCQFKSVDQCIAAVTQLMDTTSDAVVATRITDAQWPELISLRPDIAEATTMVWRPRQPSGGRVAIVERRHIRHPGRRRSRVDPRGDGPCRQPNHRRRGRPASIAFSRPSRASRMPMSIIAIAGMEGALPTVLAGLVPHPIVAVPDIGRLRIVVRRDHGTADDALELCARDLGRRHRQRLRGRLRRPSHPAEMTVAPDRAQPPVDRSLLRRLGRHDSRCASSRRRRRNLVAAQLAGLNLPGVTVSFESAMRCGLSATRAVVSVPSHADRHRPWSTIDRMLVEAPLPRDGVRWCPHYVPTARRDRVAHPRCPHRRGSVP